MTSALVLVFLAVQNPPEKYVNTKSGFEVVPPRGWTTAATATSPTVQFQEPSTGTERLRGEIVLSNVMGDAPMAPSGMKDSVRRYMDKEHTGYEQLWEAETPVGGEPAYSFGARLKRKDRGALIVVRAMVSRTLVDRIYVSGVFDDAVGADAARKTADEFLKSMKFVPRGVSAEDQKAIDRLAGRIKVLTDAQHRMATDEWYSLHVGEKRIGYNRVGWYHLKSEGATINNKAGLKYSTTVVMTDAKGNSSTITTEGSFTLDLSSQTETLTEAVKDDKGATKRSHTLKGRIEGGKAFLDWTVGDYKATKEAAVPGLTMFAGTAELIRRALVPGAKDSYAARVLMVSEDSPRLEYFDVNEPDRGQINDQMTDFQQISIRRDIGTVEAFFDKAGSMMNQTMNGGRFLMKRTTEAEATKTP